MASLADADRFQESMFWSQEHVQTRPLGGVDFLTSRGSVVVVTATRRPLLFRDRGPRGLTLFLGTIKKNLILEILQCWKTGKLRKHRDMFSETDDSHFWPKYTLFGRVLVYETKKDLNILPTPGNSWWVTTGMSEFCSSKKKFKSYTRAGTGVRLRLQLLLDTCNWCTSQPYGT